ncbi:MAG: 4Fe-4S dicluster domain-containing protein [Candidatus Electrothrix sp. AR3]|nr:4Fe-4S dicluster domain-containing protein [Candidatus Electrothrix sp. AR3]
MWNVEIDKNKCTGCEECVNSCPAEVLDMVDRDEKEKKNDKDKKKSDKRSEAVNIDECLGCETCVEVCPEEAITVSED